MSVLVLNWKSCWPWDFPCQYVAWGTANLYLFWICKVKRVTSGRSVIYRRTSTTNVQSIVHTAQSYSFQVPQHADTVELKPADWNMKANTQVFSPSSPLRSLLPRNSEIMFFDIWWDASDDVSWISIDLVFLQHSECMTFHMGSMHVFPLYYLFFFFNATASV